MEGRSSSPLDEFLIFGGRPLEDTENVPFSWTRANTLNLLDFFKKYRTKVGTLQIKTLKKLWDVISQEFKWRLNIVVTPNNCEIRWRILERNFKKYIDNKNQTGAGRKDFEYAEEMEEILGKKKNIHPTVVLTQSTISNIPPPKRTYSDTGLREPVAGCLKQLMDDAAEDVQVHTPKGKKIKLNLMKSSERRTYMKKIDVLEKLLLEKQDRHKERMQLEKQRFEKYSEIESMRAQQIEVRNDMLQESMELQRRNNSLLEQLLERFTEN